MQLGRIVIGHAESESVTIEVVGSQPDGWRVTHVEVACDGWRGSFRWQFSAGELRRFGYEVQELYRELSGAAILVPMQPNLELKMTGDGKGHVIVEGKAEPELSSGTYLVFRLSLDQTDLLPIAAALIAFDPS